MAQKRKSNEKPKIVIGDETYLIRAAAADFLGKGERVLYDWQAAGLLEPTSYIGKSAYYSLKDLHRWMASGGARQRRGRPRKVAI